MKVLNLGAAFIFVAAAASPYVAAAAPDGHDHHEGHGTAASADDAAGHDDHSDHTGHDHGPPKTSSDYEVSSSAYQIPAVSLTDQYGRSVRLDRLLAEERPTLVQFIFTSCTTICPVMGAVFGGAQTDIAALAPDYRMVSISIDPEYDTPERLREFAAKQNANPEWVLLTGSKEAVMQATKAFDALYQGDNKMYHQPYTFIRWRTSDDWVRIRGLMSITDLVKEFSDARKEGI
ncbi:MAG TPA: SCO family protein [Parvularcula sp.]|nr:SCO family protein [Parvularcula sp.]HBS33045.1 SCO family protein [Parvularcula sp.]HBS35708.1 SCO family protein [Parvularcula sp.]